MNKKLFENKGETPEPGNSDTGSKKIEISVTDNREKEEKNPFLHPLVLSGIVGAAGGLITTLLIIMSGDNQLSRLLMQADSLDSKIGKYQCPVGTILAYGGPMSDSIEAHLKQMRWLICNGQQFDRTNFDQLHQVIGEFWGRGNGLTTFNLPNLQGLFLRGVDPNGTNDPDFRERTNWRGEKGPDVGSFQADAFREHNHAIPKYVYDYGSINEKAPSTIPNGVGNAFAWDGNGLGTGNRGDKETRPKNAYVYYLIKY
jgi:hypothetical protein